jgi:phosphohistidine phosphatase
VKLLYLLRHAKSSWDEPGLADADRPLAPRGRRAARTVAEHVHEEGIAPSLVLCSSALRARQTLAALVGVLPAGVEIRIEDGLYAADADELLERLLAVPAETPSALVVGHNPGLHELALLLASAGAGLERFPTGALATLRLPAEDWRELRPHTGELAALVLPRELAS